MYHEDYLMQQIRMATRFVAKLLTGKQDALVEIPEEAPASSGEPFLETTLKNMAASGKINEAENLLFAKIAQEPQLDYLYAGLRFYEALQGMQEEILQLYHFSHEEVLEGLRDLQRIYQIPVFDFTE